MKHPRQNSYDELPMWDGRQLKLFSMVAREFVLPLSFVSQVNKILSDSDISPEESRQLKQAAQQQFDDYLSLSQSIQQIYHGSFETLALEPLNPRAVMDEVIGQYVPRIKRQSVVVSDDALVLSNRPTLAQALTSLFKYIGTIKSRTGHMNIEIKAVADKVVINIIDSKSSLTRPQVKQSLSAVGIQNQSNGGKSLNSALQLVLAQSLCKQINGKLDFQRRRGRAQWTISLPRSRQLALWT